jgi:hypothetical protein
MLHQEGTLRFHDYFLQHILAGLRTISSTELLLFPSNRQAITLISSTKNSINGAFAQAFTGLTACCAAPAPET